jgi:hypothetical protein
MARKKSAKAGPGLLQTTGEIWEVGRRTINVPVAELERRGEQPQVLLAVQAEEQGGIVAAQVVPSGLPPVILAEFLQQAMKQPMIGKPRRPEAIRVSSPAEAEVLAEALATAGVGLEVAPQLLMLDRVCNQMEIALGGFTRDYRTQAARAGQSLSEDGLHELFRTAQEFYEAEMWISFDDLDLFEIELQPVQGASQTMFALIMGNAGQEYGLALYPSLWDMQRIYEINQQYEDELLAPPDEFEQEPFDPDEMQEKAEVMAELLSVPSVSLTYSTRQEVPPQLLEEAKQLKLPITDKSAFPLVMKVGQGQMQLGMAEDLSNATLAMRAILDWDEQMDKLDVTEEVGVTLTSQFAAVADFFPEMTVRTTLRRNPFLPEEEDGPPELSDFLDALFAGSQSPAKAKSKKAPSKKKQKAAKSAAPTSPHIYTLNVYLTGGPLSEEYEGAVVSRKIEILGEQTLHDLHETIFDAFEREEEHLYEFNLGQGPGDHSEIYSYQGEWGGDEEEGDPEETTLDSLALDVGRRFGYIFDMGDYWEHIIDVVAIDEGPGKGEYPRVTERVGTPPPQYPDLDEEE